MRVVPVVAVAQWVTLEPSARSIRRRYRHCRRRRRYRRRRRHCRHRRYRRCRRRFPSPPAPPRPSRATSAPSPSRSGSRLTCAPLTCRCSGSLASSWPTRPGTFTWTCPTVGRGGNPTHAHTHAHAHTCTLKHALSHRELRGSIERPCDTARWRTRRCAHCARTCCRRTGTSSCGSRAGQGWAPWTLPSPLFGTS